MKRFRLDLLLLNLEMWLRNSSWVIGLIGLLLLASQAYFELSSDTIYPIVLIICICLSSVATVLEIKNFDYEYSIHQNKKTGQSNLDPEEFAYYCLMIAFYLATIITAIVLLITH